MKLTLIFLAFGALASASYIPKDDGKPVKCRLRPKDKGDDYSKPRIGTVYQCAKTNEERCIECVEVGKDCKLSRNGKVELTGNYNRKQLDDWLAKGKIIGTVTACARVGSNEYCYECEEIGKNCTLKKNGKVELTGNYNKSQLESYLKDGKMVG